MHKHVEMLKEENCVGVNYALSSISWKVNCVKKMQGYRIEEWLLNEMCFSQSILMETCQKIPHKYCFLMRLGIKIIIFIWKLYAILSIYILRVGSIWNYFWNV